MPDTRSSRQGRGPLAAFVLVLLPAAALLAATPQPDPVAKGKKLFQESQCVNCHSLTAKRESYQVGPALLGVTGRPGRTKEWIIRWISDPEGLLRSDPQAKKLLAEFNNIPMTPMLRLMSLKPDGTPDLEVVKAKAEAIYAFLAANDAVAKGGSAPPAAKKPGS